MPGFFYLPRYRKSIFLPWAMMYSLKRRTMMEDDEVLTLRAIG
jgi:hypothetical protein